MANEIKTLRTPSINAMGRSLAVTSAALTPFAGQAVAQSAPPIWTGTYVGAQTGLEMPRATTSYAFVHSGYGFSSSNGQARNNWQAPEVGVYFGYNKQFGRIVAGFEGDINARFGSSRAMLIVPALGKANGLGGSTIGSLRVKNEWETSLRARLGFLATDRILVFGTAGVSWADFTFSGLVPGFPPGAADAISRLSGIRTGLVVGGGFEYALNENWHAKIEALHRIYHSKSSSYTGNSGEDTYLASFRSKLRSTTIRIGLSHRFGTATSPSLP